MRIHVILGNDETGERIYLTSKTVVIHQIVLS